MYCLFSIIIVYRTNEIFLVSVKFLVKEWSFVMRKIMITFVFFLMQFLVLIAAFVLEYLAPKKMGVNRYLLYKKTKYSQSLLTPELVSGYEMITIIGLIIFIVFLIIQVKKRENWFPVLMAIIYQVAGLVILAKDNLYAYPFFVLGIGIVITLQFIWILVRFFYRKKA